jgi:excisionase family DNA binding protein
VAKLSDHLGVPQSCAATGCRGGPGHRHLDTFPAPSSPTNSLLDIPAVAARLGVSSKTVRRHIEHGEIAVHHIGRLLRVSEEDLANYIAGRRKSQWKEKA